MGWLYSFLLQLAIEIAIENTKVYVRKTIDDFGQHVIQIYRKVTGSDGEELTQVIGEIEAFVPEIIDGVCLTTNADGEIGFGTPEIEVVDGFSFGDSLSDDTIMYTGDGLLLDYDADGEVDDYIVSLPYDLNGDGFNDYGLIVDDDNDGLPDASPDAPFFEIGSDEFNHIVSERSGAGESIIIMSADGSMSVYDMDGNLTAEDCDTAYSLWVSENGIMSKPLDNYTVTEGLLLIAGVVACFGFIGKLFRRRKVM